MTDEALAPGARVGTYRILRQLAQGGMAELYLARKKGLSGFEKTVVLKRLLPRLASNDEFVEMFLDEARLTGTLTHPNVVQVFDVERIGTSQFFTMEYVHGRDLARVLEECAKARRGLTLSLGLHIAMQVASGLHYAHDKKAKDGQPIGTVHRDISPKNVMLTHDGQVKIVDFGIAKAAVQQSKTETGTVKGTIPYMSPEQAQGLDLDRRSDVFSLGVLLFELTTGTRPFRAKNDFAVLFKIVNEAAPAPSSRRATYPPKLERIVQKALARDRENRYATAEELRLDLERFARAENLLASESELGRLMRDLFGELDADVDAEPIETSLPIHAKTDGRKLALWFVIAIVLLTIVGVGLSFAKSPDVATSTTPGVVPTIEAPKPVLSLTVTASATRGTMASSTASANERAVHAKVPRATATTPSANSASPKEKTAPKWDLDSPLPP